MADVARVGAVGGAGRVSYGAPFEQFLLHVGREEKFRFLDEAGRVLDGWKEAPSALRDKFGQVRRTYGIFTHYRALFAALSAAAKIDLEVVYRLMGAFWILFLRAKSRLPPRPPSEAHAAELQLLMAAVGYAFDRMAVGVGREAVA
jgi:hypothetical protein